MHELLRIECRHSGPMPAEDRWSLRCGGRAAYERARSKAAIRFLSERCVCLVRTMTPSVALHDAVRRLLAEQRRWTMASS
jgi:hypothetical protein